MKNSEHKFIPKIALSVIMLFGFLISSYAQPVINSDPKGAGGGETCFYTAHDYLDVFVTVQGTETVDYQSLRLNNVPVQILTYVKSIYNVPGASGFSGGRFAQTVTFKFRLFLPLPLNVYQDSNGKIMAGVGIYWSDGRPNGLGGDYYKNLLYRNCGTGTGSAFGGGDVLPSQSNRSTEVQIYPNPVFDSLDLLLDLTDEQLIDVTVVSLSGEKMKSFDFSRENIDDRIFKQKIDLSELIPGAYFLNIRTSQTMVTRKIIKQ